MPPDDDAPNQSPETQADDVEEVDLDALVGSAVEERLKALGIGGGGGGAPASGGSSEAAGSGGATGSPVPSDPGAIERTVNRLLDERGTQDRIKALEDRTAEPEPAPARKGIGAALFGKERSGVSALLHKLGL